MHKTFIPPNHHQTIVVYTASMELMIILFIKSWSLYLVLHFDLTHFFFSYLFIFRTVSVFS